MADGTTSETRRTGFLRHPVLWSIVGLLVIALLAAVLAETGRVVVTIERDRAHQRAIAPFYDPPQGFAAAPLGAVLRRAPLGVTVEGGRAWRILYRSEFSDGTPTVSSGMLLVPDGPAPPAGRPVFAWAHGTVGLGDTCAPSRQTDPLKQLAWAPAVLRAGFVVVATDYAGLGTPGVSRYLVGPDEARDVLNSVRAAERFRGAGAGNRSVVYGHSQGGHSALWTGSVAPDYAPELDLVAIAAAAPAAELSALLRLQDDTVVAWVIGPEVMRAWPKVYPRLDTSSVLTAAGRRFGNEIAERCVLVGGLQGLILEKLGQHYFSGDPARDPLWARALREQTPPPLPADLPVLVGQGLDDTVVLPTTTALLEQRWCAAGSRLTMAWLGDLQHLPAGLSVGPLASTFFQQALAGAPAIPTCDTRAPVPAAR